MCEGDVGIAEAGVELDWMNVFFRSGEARPWNRRVLAWLIESHGYGQCRTAKSFSGLSTKRDTSDPVPSFHRDDDNPLDIGQVTGIVAHIEASSVTNYIGSLAKSLNVVESAEEKASDTFGSLGESDFRTSFNHTVSAMRGPLGFDVQPDSHFCSWLDSDKPIHRVVCKPPVPAQAVHHHLDSLQLVHVINE